MDALHIDRLETALSFREHMHQPRDPLSTWRNGPTKDAIVGFVTRVTDAGGKDFVPPEERIATFDNDGTLWCEKPLPVQVDFILRRLAEAATKDPTLRSREPWRAAFEKDYAWLGSVITKHYEGDDRPLEEAAGGILASFDGAAVEELEREAHRFLYGEKNPKLGRLYTQCAFVPMVDLLRYLRAHGFSTYIASGGGRDFVRVVSHDLYGIPRENVIGSTTSLRYEDDDHGGTIRHGAKIDLFDDGPAKPVGIWNRLGRRPILAAGNANGDLAMLRFAGRERPALRVVVLHDDPEREFDYVAGADRVLAVAKQERWTVTSMKRDWTTIFERSEP